jgi:hypothetical protein
VPRFSQPVTSVRRTVSAWSTSAAVSPVLRARMASRAPRGSCPWMASSRPATASAVVPGGPDSSWAAARSASSWPDPGGAAEFAMA